MPILYLGWASVSGVCICGLASIPKHLLLCSLPADLCCFSPSLGDQIFPEVFTSLYFHSLSPKSQPRSGADMGAMEYSLVGMPLHPVCHPQPFPSHHHYPLRSTNNCLLSLPWALRPHVHILGHSHIGMVIRHLTARPTTDQPTSWTIWLDLIT